MKKAKDQLQALLDREAIRDLPLRYCDCVWRNDVAGLIKLFSKEGEFVISTKGEESGAKGHADLLDFYRKGLEIGPRPFIHNHVIELRDPKRATGRCYLALHSAQQNMDFIGAGYYADSYVKVKGEWRFARRHFTAVRLDQPATKSAAPAAKPKTARARRAKIH